MSCPRDGMERQKRKQNANVNRFEFSRGQHGTAQSAELDQIAQSKKKCWQRIAY